MLSWSALCYAHPNMSSLLQILMDCEGVDAVDQVSVRL